MVKIEDKCPVCGSRDVCEGVWDDARVRVKGKVFASSYMLAQVCGDCGAIFNLRVAKPERFSRREKD